MPSASGNILAQLGQAPPRLVRAAASGLAHRAGIATMVHMAEASQRTLLSRDFFERDARLVARAMVGTILLRVGSDGRPTQLVRIVETEAYRGPPDAACHARFGVTTRTRTLFGPPGHAYVFLIYGMYDCFNVTCFGEGTGHAVLVRAVEPLSGVGASVRTDGPGRLTRALSITRGAHDGIDMCGAQATLRLLARPSRPRIAVSARVGVGYAGRIAEAQWRFFDPTSRHVSRPSPRTIGLGGLGGKGVAE